MDNGGAARSTPPPISSHPSESFTTTHPLAKRRTPQTHHPGWQFRSWDLRSARALAARDYPFLLAAFNGYGHPVQRADAARWMVLHAFGGVYMDTDVECFANVEASLAGRELALNCESAAGERDGTGARGRACRLVGLGWVRFLSPRQQLEGCSLERLSAFDPRTPPTHSTNSPPARQRCRGQRGRQPVLARGDGRGAAARGRPRLRGARERCGLLCLGVDVILYSAEHALMMYSIL